VSPGTLAHTSYALREALQLLGLPAVEVQLVKPRKGEAWRRTSLLADVVQKRVVGGGTRAFLEALEHLASLAPTPRVAPAVARAEPPSKAPVPKTLGRASGTLARAAASGGTKTLGRASSRTGAASASEVLTRALVRQKIAERLSGSLSPSALASWARTRWFDVQRGAPAESGQRELLEESLQTLTLSALPTQRMSDEQLIELMAQLDR
jgi:3-dehydroquinate dehydratase-2